MGRGRYIRRCQRKDGEKCGWELPIPNWIGIQGSDGRLNVMMFKLKVRSIVKRVLRGTMQEGGKGRGLLRSKKGKDRKG